ncbi:MAG: regulatory protein RecX [Bacteroidota bacterium]
MQTCFFIFAWMEDLNIIKKKVARYCAWRDRCTAEVIKKLQELNATSEQIPQVIHWLEDEKYLDEKRFATSYVRGKFSVNHWGRMRIIAELRSRNIAESTIREALKSIDTDDYFRTMQRLADAKYHSIKSDDRQIKKQKTIAYLTSRGFEQDLIWDVVKTMK